MDSYHIINCQYYRDSVTHIITEYETAAKALKVLKVTELPQHTRLLKVSWFTDSIKAREPVPVQDKHVIAQGGDAVSLIILNLILKNKSEMLKSTRVAFCNFTRILIIPLV